MKLAKHAAETNKIFMLSLSAPFIPQFFKDPLAEVLPYTDYVFGNETEAATWAASQGREDLKENDVPEIAKLMAKYKKVNQKRPRIVVFTQGTKPAVTAVAKADGEVEVREYPVHEIKEDQINDTNGAG